MKCSFCNESQETSIIGPVHGVAICDECLALYDAVLLKRGVDIRSYYSDEDRKLLWAISRLMEATEGSQEYVSEAVSLLTNVALQNMEHFKRQLPNEVASKCEDGEGKELQSKPTRPLKYRMSPVTERRLRELDALYVRLAEEAPSCQETGHGVTEDAGRGAQTRPCVADDVERDAHASRAESRVERRERMLRNIREIGERYPEIKRYTDKACELVERGVVLAKETESSQHRIEEDRRVQEELIRYLLAFYKQCGQERSRRHFCAGRMKMRFSTRCGK